MPSAAVYIAQGFSTLRSRLPSWPHWRRELTPPPVETSSPAALARMIESEIIPRLLVAHGPASKLHIVDYAEPNCIGEADILAFASMSVDADAAGLLDFAEERLSQGIGVETLLLDLIIPAARELGTRWEDDSADFIDVTMGLWRMQELAYELMGRVPVSRKMSRYRALFSSMPDDQHSFAPLMIEEFFRVAGWQTRSLVEPVHDNLVAIVGGGDYDLCALTVTRQEDVARVAPLIRDVRNASPNPKLIVLVGGRAMPHDPDFVEACGADGTARDAREAVSVAAQLVEARMEISVES